MFLSSLSFDIRPKDHLKRSIIHLVLDMAPARVTENESCVSTGVLHSQPLFFTFEDREQPLRDFYSFGNSNKNSRKQSSCQDVSLVTDQLSY